MKGWYKESHRHYLAAKGIKTSKYLAKKSFSIKTHPPMTGRKYPVTCSEVRAALNKENTKGLTAVEFRNPRDEQQKNAYAQYMRGQRKLVIFSQPVIEQVLFVEGQELVPKQEMKKLVTKKVIPHEMSHHQILYRDKITDKTPELAEARAEALRRGKDYKSEKVVKNFIGAHV